MKNNELKFQVAVACLQSIIESKFGGARGLVPAIAVKESLILANEFMKQWEKEEK